MYSEDEKYISANEVGENIKLYNEKRAKRSYSDAEEVALDIKVLLAGSDMLKEDSDKLFDKNREDVALLCYEIAKYLKDEEKIARYRKCLTAARNSKYWDLTNRDENWEPYGQTYRGLVKIQKLKDFPIIKIFYKSFKSGGFFPYDKFLGFYEINCLRDSVYIKETALNEDALYDLIAECDKKKKQPEKEEEKPQGFWRRLWRR